MAQSAIGPGPPGPRHQWAATRRQQPVNTTQLALTWKRQPGTIAEHQWPSGPCSGGRRGLDRAGHPHSPVGTSSQGSSPATPLLLMAATHGHGKGGRKRNRGNLAQGATCGAQAPERVGPQASYGPWVRELLWAGQAWATQESQDITQAVVAACRGTKPGRRSLCLGGARQHYTDCSSRPGGQLGLRTPRAAGGWGPRTLRGPRPPSVPHGFLSRAP